MHIQKKPGLEENNHYDRRIFLLWEEHHWPNNWPSWLNYLYIDSGAMYRAITLYFIQHTVNWNDAEAVKQALQSIHLEFIHNQISGQSDMYLNDENVEPLIREMLVGGKR